MAPLSNAKGALPSSISFLGSQTEEVLVSTLKPADDGRGMIVRLWNPGLKAAAGRIAVKEPVIEVD